MLQLIFHSLIALMLVVSCECKDMHIRRMPEEKDIAFKGEVKKPQKTVYRKGESREIQVHLTSSDEEAQDAQFKILSATLADGSPADLDYTSLKLGKNTLHYTPQKPGTHELTLKVAVEGEEESAQILHYTLEAPAANWQVRGTANDTGNLTLQIVDVPEELQGESWRITNTTWSRGLQGTIADTSTLKSGDNNLQVALLTPMALEEPHVSFTIQGPDSETRTCQIDLKNLSAETLKKQLGEEETREIQDLMSRANSFPISDLNETRLNDLSVLVEELKSTERKYAHILRSTANISQTENRMLTDIELRRNYNILDRKYQTLKRKTQEFSRKLGRESREVQNRMRQELYQAIQRTDLEAIENILNECILSEQQLGEIMLNLTKYGLGNGDSFTSKQPSGLTIEESERQKQTQRELRRDLGDIEWLERDSYGRKELKDEEKYLFNWKYWGDFGGNYKQKKGSKTYPLTENFKQTKTRERKEVYRIFIEKGADLEIRDEDGETALTRALQDEEDLAILRMLLETGTTLGDPTEQEGKTALEAAVERPQANKAEVIEAVLNQYETNQQQLIDRNTAGILNNINPNHEENGIVRNIYNILGNVQNYIQRHNQGRLLYYLIRCSHADENPRDLANSLNILRSKGIDLNATFDTGWGILTPMHTIMDDWNRCNVNVSMQRLRIPDRLKMESEHGYEPPADSSLTEEEIAKRAKFLRILNEGKRCERRTLQKSLNAIETILSSGGNPNVPFMYRGTNPMYYATGHEGDEYSSSRARIVWNDRNSTRVETQNYLWPGEEEIPEYRHDIILFKNIIARYIEEENP